MPARSLSKGRALFVTSGSPLRDSENPRSAGQDLSMITSARLSFDSMSHKRKMSLNSNVSDNGYDLSDPPKDPTELVIWLSANINVLRAAPYENMSEISTPTTPNKKRRITADDFSKDVETLAKDQEKRDHAKMRKARSRARPQNWLQNKKNDVHTRVNSIARSKFGSEGSVAKDDHMRTQFTEAWDRMVERTLERLRDAVSGMPAFSEGFDEVVFPRDDMRHLVSDAIGRSILRVFLFVGSSRLRSRGLNAARALQRTLRGNSEEEFGKFEEGHMYTASQVLANHADVQDALDVIFKTIFLEGQSPVTGPSFADSSNAIQTPNGHSHKKYVFSPVTGLSDVKDVNRVNGIASLNQAIPANGSSNVQGTDQFHKIPNVNETNHVHRVSNTNGPRYAESTTAALGDRSIVNGENLIEPRQGYSNKPAFKLSDYTSATPNPSTTPGSQKSGMFLFRVDNFKVRTSSKSIGPGGDGRSFDENARSSYDRSMNGKRSQSVATSVSSHITALDLDVVGSEQEPPRGRTPTRSASRSKFSTPVEFQSIGHTSKTTRATELTSSNENSDQANSGTPVGPTVNTVISVAEGRATSELYRRMSSATPATPTLTIGDSSNGSSANEEHDEPDDYLNGQAMKYYPKSQYEWYKAPKKFPNSRIPSPPARLRSFREKEMDKVYGFPPAPGSGVTIDMSKFKKEELKKTAFKLDFDSNENDAAGPIFLRSGRKLRNRAIDNNIAESNGIAGADRTK